MECTLEDFNKFLFEANKLYNKIPTKEKTFMEVSGYPHYENVCSNILSFYFNPNYVQYNNYEYDYRKKIKIEKRYNKKEVKIYKNADVDYIFEITNNIEIYLENIVECVKYKKIGIILNIEDSETLEMYDGLISFLLENNYEVYRYEDKDKTKARHEEFIKIAKEEIGIPNFEKFKMLEIYKRAETRESINVEIYIRTSFSITS